MPGVARSLTYDSLYTTTLDNYSKQMYDQVFDNYPGLSWVNGKLGRAMGNSPVKRNLEGGVKIIEHLLYGTNSTVKSYSGAEPLDTTLQEGHTVAEFSWKQYAGAVGITGLEKAQNKGEPAMIRLLQAKIDQTTMTLRDTLSVDLWGDGTNNNSKALTGFQALIDDSTSVGGLNPSTYSWWKSDERSMGSFAANGVDTMRTAVNTVSYGNDKPNVCFTTQAAQEFYEKSLQPQERYVNAKVADAGFENVTFKMIPIIFDRDVASGEMYFLNGKYINFNVLSGMDMQAQPFQTPVGQDVTTAEILFYGNLSVNNRRMHSKITGITA